MPNNHRSSSHLVQHVIQWSLVLLIMILPFNEGGNGYILQAITQILLLVCATIWAFDAIHTRQLRIRYTRLDLLILAGLAWIAVSLVFSDCKYATILEAIKILSYTALWFLSRAVMARRTSRNYIVLSIVASGCLQFCVAFYHRFISTASAWQAGFVNPNELACFLVIGLHIALSCLLFRPRHAQPTNRNALRRWALPLFMLAAAGISGSMLPALQSRGALLSVAVTIFLLATFRHRFSGVIFLVALTLAILFPLPQGSLMQRFLKRSDPFAYQRFDIWKSSARMVSDHPILGVGLGMFSYYGTAYNFPVEHQVARYGKRLNLAHNDLLQIAAELGIVGLLLVVGGMIYLGMLSFRHLRTPEISWHVIASISALFGVFVNGMVSNLLLSPALAMMCVLLAAILVESTAVFTRKTWTIPDRPGIAASWYGALAIGVLYILVPGIGYPFLAHAHFLDYHYYRREGRLIEAVEHLNKAIRYVPMQAYYHESFGKLYTAAFRNQPNLDAYYEAYVSLTQAIRHNPRESSFYMTMADLHRTMFREMLPTRPTAENALREYGRALDVNPFNPFIHAEMASLYADLGEFDPAIRTIQDAITHEPNFVRGHQLLGEFLRHLNRKEAAQAAFDTAEMIQKTYPIRGHESEYTRTLLSSLYQ